MAVQFKNGKFKIESGSKDGQEHLYFLVDRMINNSKGKFSETICLECAETKEAMVPEVFDYMKRSGMDVQELDEWLCRYQTQQRQKRENQAKQKKSFDTLIEKIKGTFSIVELCYLENHILYNLADIEKARILNKYLSMQFEKAYFCEEDYKKLLRDQSRVGLCVMSILIAEIESRQKENEISPFLKNCMIVLDYKMQRIPDRDLCSLEMKILIEGIESGIALLPLKQRLYLVKHLELLLRSHVKMRFLDIREMEEKVAYLYRTYCTDIPFKRDKRKKTWTRRKRVKEEADYEEDYVEEYDTEEAPKKRVFRVYNLS